MPVLSEYETVALDLSRRQAEAMQHTGLVDVSPTSDGRWHVTASSYVGSMVVDGVDLLIRPKINPENLFLLLEPGLPPGAWRNEAFDYEVSNDLLPSVIAFFARTVETTLGRGVLRSYMTRRDALVAVRGRIDVVGQFKRAGVLTPAACTYDDFSEDILENRVLRSAIRKALRVPQVRPGDRQRLARNLAALEGVADVPISVESAQSIHFTRLNQHYAPALRLAGLVLANLTLVDAAGSTAASTFMVDMNNLFQRFVTEKLRSALRGRLDVIDEPTVRLDDGRRVTMKPDLEFCDRDGAVRYVGDVKYKLAAGGRARSGDYYQLLAYTTALDLPEGLLIYCRRRGGESVTPDVRVRNTGKRLAIHQIDLSGPAPQVEVQIDELADRIAVAAGRPVDRLNSVHEDG